MQLAESLARNDALRQLYSLVPSGVLGVGAMSGSGPIGLAVSSFSTISLTPALVGLNMQKGSTTWPALSMSPRIGISLLAHGQHEIGRQLAGPDKGARFANVEYFADDEGAVFIRGAVLWLEAKVSDSIEAGDHTIEVLEVLRTAAAAGSDPLIFHRRAFTTVMPK